MKQSTGVVKAHRERRGREENMAIWKILKRKRRRIEPQLESIEQAKLLHMSYDNSIRKIITLGNTTSNAFRDIERAMNAKVDQLREESTEALQRQVRRANLQQVETRHEIEVMTAAAAKDRKKIEENERKSEQRQRDNQRRMAGVMAAVLHGERNLQNVKKNLEEGLAKARKEVVELREEMYKKLAIAKAKAEQARREIQKEVTANTQAQKHLEKLQAKMQAASNEDKVKFKREITKVKEAHQRAKEQTSRAMGNWTKKIAKDQQKIEKRFEGRIAAGEATMQGIQDRFSAIEGEVSDLTDRVENLEARVDDIEINLRDGSKIEVIQKPDPNSVPKGRGSYYLRCTKFGNGGTGKINCSIHGTDGDSFIREFTSATTGADTGRRAVWKPSEGPRGETIIPAGDGDVEDTVTIRDTAGEKTIYKITFAREDEGEAIVELMRGGSRKLLLDHEARLKQLEINLDDGSVVKVELHRGSYYFHCEKYGIGHRQIVCKTKGSDGMNLFRRLRKKGDGATEDLIPPGADGVRDDIEITDTEGNVTRYLIVFAAGERVNLTKIDTKIDQGSRNTLLLKMNGGNFKENSTLSYSYIVDPTNNQVLNIFSDKGINLLKKYISQLN